MNISDKIKEMQDDLGKYHVLEKNDEEIELEDMVMLMLNDQGYLGPGKIIGESDESLDFMFYKKEGPTFSLCIKKEHICGLSILHKPVEDEESATDNVEVSGALYQWFYCINLIGGNVMNLSEEVAEIEGKVKSYRLEIEGVKEIPAEEMVRVMLEEGKMLEPCRIIGESDDYIDFMVVDLENGPVFSISINKEKIVGFGTFNKPLDELANEEEEVNAVPASLYM